MPTPIYQGHCQTVASNSYEVERASQRRRPRHRRRPRPRGQGADAGHQRAGLPHEAGLGPRRHLHRPGRLLRGLPPDDARRPDLPGPRVGLLLRREHARGRAAHDHLRPHQRDPPVCGRARRPRVAGRAHPRPSAGARPQHPRRRRHLRTRRRRPTAWTRVTLDEALPDADAGPARRTAAVHGLAGPPAGRARGVGQHPQLVPPRPRPLPRVPRRPRRRPRRAGHRARRHRVPRLAARGQLRSTRPSRRRRRPARSSPYAASTGSWPWRAR